MRKKIRVLLFIPSLLLLLSASLPLYLQINGVTGKLLSNIRARLIELDHNKPLLAESDTALKEQIEKAMSPYGFFTPTIYLSRASRNHLTVTIEPGARLVMTQVAIAIIGQGRLDSAINKTLRELPLKNGKFFNSVKYEQAKQALLSQAQNQGYVHASFNNAEVFIDKDAHTAAINWQFNTGDQYFFGQVAFDPTYISPKLLHRYVPFHYGEPYSQEKVQTFNDYLTGSGYFKTVTVKADVDNGAHVPIKVHLQSARPTNYSLGVGYGTDTGIRGRAGLHVIPINRLGHKFNAVALGSFNENAVQTQYIIPGKNPLLDQYEITGSASNLNYDIGYSNAFLLSFAQRHNKSNFRRVLSLNNLYERFNYTYRPKQQKFSLFPKASLTWLNKSDQLFSPSGYRLNVQALAADRRLLSNNSFSQLSLDAKAAFTAESLRTRLYWHSTYGVTQINNINQFPLSLALLLGGSDNLKGYDYASIGPGKILIYNGFELQKETKENWYLTSFFEAGDIYKPNTRAFKKDLGIGLMWVSPVGPIKIELAQAIDEHFKRVANKHPKIVIHMGPDL